MFPLFAVCCFFLLLLLLHLSDEMEQGELITSLNHNDVLMGRGTRQNEFIGNKRFRSIIERHKEEYRSAQKLKAKQKVARKVFDEIRDLGGRFVKVVVTDAPVYDADEGPWIEVEEKVALEKCKSTLRHQETLLEGGIHEEPTRIPTLPPNSAAVLPSMMCHGRRDDIADARFSDFQYGMVVPQPQGTYPFNPLQFNVSLQIQNDMSITPGLWYHPALEPASLPILPSNLTAALLSMVVDNRWADVADGRFFGSQQDTMVPQLQGTNPFNTFQVNVRPQSQNDMSIRPTTFTAPKHALAREEISDGPVTEAEDQSKDIGCAVAITSPPMSKEDASDLESEDLSKFLLSVFEEPDLPRFTEEQEEAERNALTDEERAAALSDLLGTKCAVDIHKSKKARQDFDCKTTSFYVNQMRLEINQIPEENKRALMEAQQLKCHADEFRDARLEQFLRCEGMNAKVCQKVCI